MDYEEDPDISCSDIAHRSKTLFTTAYNGIPETLIINVLLWILLIMLFTVMRQQAWDYGRLALFNNRESSKRWTQVFYAHGNDGNADSPTSPIGSGEQGFFSWIWITFKLKKEDFLNHTGPDAVHYLSFQQHIIFVMGLICAVSMLVIFPVNFFNGIPVNGTYPTNSFGRTTMANLNSDSPWLWVHVIVAISFVPLVVLIMRRASGRNAFKKAPTRTIMITNISMNDRNKTVVRNYIQELFPDVTIEDVQLAYNISKLSTKSKEFEQMMEARLYCEEHRNRNSLTASPELCSCKKVPAYEYYLEEERKLAGEVSRLRAAALNNPLGTAFVTVSSVYEAQNIVSHFKPGSYRQWYLEFAPSPNDIFWENLNVSSRRWYIKWAAVNITLFLVLFFLTTPAMIVNFLSTYALSNGEINAVSPLISDFLPTLMLWTMSALMPVIVAYSDKWLSHYTRSLQNYAIMTKCFGYLLFMILILPSLGLASAEAFLDWSLSNETEKRLQCIFLPDRGAFYINYVITAAFIGTALELIRFPDLIVYVWELCTAKSKAETPYIRKSILIEYPFGVHYAWTVLVFTVSVVYSVISPLITPFAMIYLCLKHFGDRHNLYFAYGPSNMISQSGGKIHSTAVTMTKFSVVILLLILAGVSAIRGQGTARAIVLIFTLIVTLTMFTFMSPLKRCTSARRPSISEVDGPAPRYEAEVLKPKVVITGPSGSVSGYGSESVVDADLHNVVA